MGRLGGVQFRVIYGSISIVNGSSRNVPTLFFHACTSLKTLFNVFRDVVGGISGSLRSGLYIRANGSRVITPCHRLISSKFFLRVQGNFISRFIRGLINGLRLRTSIVRPYGVRRVFRRTSRPFKVIVGVFVSLLLNYFIRTISIVRGHIHVAEGKTGQHTRVI